MSIVSSTYQLDGPVQVSGWQGVKEKHTDSTGKVHEVYYMAPPGADYQAIANARGVKIANALAERETEEVLNGG